jgi:hypothetical protein
LNDHVHGINVEEQSIAPKWTDCEVCVQTKLHRLVSKRAQSEPADLPFYQLGMDLVQLREKRALLQWRPIDAPRGVSV